MGFSPPGHGTWLEAVIFASSLLVLWYYLWTVFWPRIRHRVGLAPDYERRTEELMQSHRQSPDDATQGQT